MRCKNTYCQFQIKVQQLVGNENEITKNLELNLNPSGTGGVGLDKTVSPSYILFYNFLVTHPNFMKF